MSVVPLLHENGATVATTPEAFEKAGGALDGKAVLILDIDQQQVADRSSSNVCYDLRIGREYRDHRDRGKYELPPEAKFQLAPGAAVIVETEESVHLPRQFFALVVPKVGMLQRGLSNTMSKVDPGYRGRLLVTLFNLGKRTVTLERHERFCSLCVLRVENGAMLYGKGAKSIEGPSKGFGWNTVRDSLERNTGAWNVAQIAATIALLLSQVYLYMHLE